MDQAKSLENIQYATPDELISSQKKMYFPNVEFSALAEPKIWTDQN